MEASITRRMEILTQIARLGKQQKETARRIISTGRRSPKGEASYDDRAQRVAELVLTAILNLRGGAASHAGNGMATYWARALRCAKIGQCISR